MFIKSMCCNINNLKSELFIAILVNSYLLFITFSNRNDQFYKRAKFIRSNKSMHVDGLVNYSNIHLIDKTLHYILLWYPDIMPYPLLPKKQDAFLNNCAYSNCYISYTTDYLKDMRDYDAIVFSGCSLRHWKNKLLLPEKTTPRQKFVFATLESSVNCPVTNPIYDDFFDWTVTFRLDSDITWKYISVYDINETEIAPAIDVKWETTLKPIGKELKRKLNRKTKAVAWFVSHCRTSSGREKFVKKLDKESIKYGWTVDKYGLCANNTTCRSRSIWCYKMLERKYHFYLAFENTFNEDYVSEKILVSLNNLVVPVVYGGANYSRFLPPGSYLDARILGPRKLAEIMNDLMNNKTAYNEFFKWTNHYKFVSSEKTDMCKLCNALNNKDFMMKKFSHKQFRIWWNGPERQKVYDVMIEKFMGNNAFLDLVSDYNFTREGSKAVWSKIKKFANQSRELVMLNKERRIAGPSPI